MLAATVGVTSAQAAPSGGFSGFHLGAVLGGGWSKTTWDVGPGGIGGDPLGVGGFPATGLTTGVVTGARAGYTLQVGAFAFGVEGMFAGTNVDGQIECGTDAPYLYGYICVTDLKGIATATARAGIVLGNTFLYGTGGIAWAFQHHQLDEPFFFGFSWGEADETARGLVLGAGVEQRLSHGFSIRADYSYVRIGAHEVILESPFVADSEMTLTQGYHFASIGFDFRFGGAPLATPARSGGWSFEAGTRQWAGSSRYAWDLFNPYDPSEQISRIDFHGTMLAGEAFLRAENGGRLFVNALFGTGATIGGTLVDDDYPPLTDPQSQTLSVLGSGRTSYANVDAGLTIAENDRWAAGAFVGVGTLLERYAAYGCEQLAGGASCSTTPIPTFLPVLTQTSIWGTLRVGVIGQVGLTERLWLRGEATAIPLAFVAGEDNHWFRPNINPLPLLARGHGFELQATLTYAVTDTFSMGLGARFGQLVAHGTAYFPGIAEPQTTVSRRAGVFLQMSHTFGG